MKYLDKVLQRWRIRKTAPHILPGACLLDIGTADGALFRLITNLSNSVGLDIELDSENLLRSPHVTFYRGSFPEALPGPRTFDVITMLATLEHIPSNQLESLAKDCATHLRPGGRLIITVPSPFVDKILIVLQQLRLIDGMALEQHYGFDVRNTEAIFTPAALKLTMHRRFQLGLNHLFVFEREAPIPETH